MVKSPLPRNIFLCGVLAACFSLFAPVAGFSLEGLPREKGALYLEDFFEQPYRLRVLADAPIYFNADLARFLGTLTRGRLVELQAINDKDGRLRVKGEAHQGQVVGWVEARYFSALDPAFVIGLRRSIERRQRVQTLAANGEIALGMTMEEVVASLGAPTKKLSHSDAQGVAEAWEYIHYVSVPRQVNSFDGRGRVVTSIVYEKVATGKFSVSFGGGVVTAIDRANANLAAGTEVAPVQSVPPPVAFSSVGRNL